GWWRVIVLAVKALPEGVFKRLKLWGYDPCPVSGAEGVRVAAAAGGDAPPPVEQERLRPGGDRLRRSALRRPRRAARAGVLRALLRRLQRGVPGERRRRPRQRRPPSAQAPAAG